MTNGIRVEDHLGLARKHAHHRGWFLHVDWHELLGSCYEGLARAAETYDPAHKSKASFRTWAIWKMRSVLSAEAAKFRSGLPTQRLGFDPAGRNSSAPALDTHELVEKALRGLSARDRLILMRTAGGATNKAVGDDLGISKERVRQLRVRAMQQCREALSGSQA